MAALIGSWDLVDTYRLGGGGGREYYLGEMPRGRLTYTREGYMHAIMVSSMRPKSIDTPVKTQDKAALFDSIIAYSGTYLVEQKKVTHHVDVAWNESWIGRDKVRFFELTGDRLVIQTEQTKDLNSDMLVTYVVEWRRSVEVLA